ncbi:MAG: hypothetical protein AAFO84_15515, partial [Cyanobacteria bacterium J06598_1]
TGTTWNNISTDLTEEAALLLDAQTKMRFLPATDFNGQPGTIKARLIDSSHPNFEVGDLKDARFSTSGSPFSQAFLFKTINPLNDAPTIVSEAAPTFPSFLEDTKSNVGNASTVASLFQSAFEDSIDSQNNNQNQFIGIAIVQDFESVEIENRTADSAIGAAKGHWEVYDVRDKVWVALPSDLSTDNAYLVPQDTKIRFTPNSRYNGELPPLTVHLIDNGARQAIGLGERISLLQTGVGGATSYSTETVQLTGEIEAINNFRPSVTGAERIKLSAEGQVEDAIAPAKTVAEIFGAHFLDNDTAGYSQTAHTPFADAQFWGVLIQNVRNETGGQWEYSNNGDEWNALPVSSDSEQGFYVPASYQLRFRQTDAHYNDEKSNIQGDQHTLQAYLVDSSITDTNIASRLKNEGEPMAGMASATPTPNRAGEAQPISSSRITLTQAITALNDAPLATETSTVLTLEPNDTDLVQGSVSQIFGQYFNDSADGPVSQQTLSGIAIVANSAKVQTEGTWQYASAENARWQNLPTGVLSESNALLLSSNAVLRFLPAEGSIGMPTDLQVALVDDTAMIPFGESGIDLTERGGATPFSQQLVTFSAQSVIEDNGDVTLMANHTQVMAGESAISFNEADIHTRQFPGWQLMAAESIEGQNQLLWHHAENQELGTWTLDENWAFLSGQTVAAESPEALSLIAQFELENDRIEQSGNTALLQNAVGQLLAQANNSERAPAAIKLNGKIITADQFAGWEVMAAETIGGENQLLWRNTETQEIGLWTLDDNWNYESVNAFDGGSSEVASLVEQFALPGTMPIESNGDVTLAHNSVKQLIVNNEENIAVTFNQAAVSADQFAGWEVLAAETIEGTNQLLWRNKETQQLGIWTMDDSWVYESAEAFDLGTEAAMAQMEQFGVSKNDPAQGAIAIEEVGSTALIRDGEGQMWVAPTNNFSSSEKLAQNQPIAIQFNSSPVYDDQFGDWMLLAADTVNEQNQLLWQNKTTQQLGVWTLDDTWNYQTASEAVDSSSETALRLAAQFNVSLLGSTPVYFDHDTIFGSNSNNFIVGGHGNDRLTGYTGNDTLIGGNGDDTLVGIFGNNTLTGGSGSDVFVLGIEQNQDVITDFMVNQDSIALSVYSLGEAAEGLFDENNILKEEEAFAIGAEATTEGHRIMYNSGTGILSLDPDGTGSLEPIQIAKLSPGLALTHQNITLDEVNFLT